MSLLIDAAKARTAVAIALVCVLASSPVVFAQSGAERASYEKLLETVKSLTEAVQREPEATSGAGRSTLDTVAARQREAEALAATGEYGVARSILDEGYRSLTQTLSRLKSGTGFNSAAGSGTSANSPGGESRPAVASHSATVDFDSRYGTTKALADALRRQNAEKNAGKDGLIADIETSLSRAQGLRSKDAAAAMTLLNETYALTRSSLQSIQTASSLKSGSAALEASRVAEGPSTVEGQRALALRHLDSVKMIRDAIERTGREKGSDSHSALVVVDTLATDARNYLTSDPARASKSAAEANRLAKEALEKVRAGR